jgi:hypothetical protein
MSTSYSNTLKVHNGFTEALTSVWVLHTSGSNYPYGQHLDFSNSPVAIGSDLVMTPPDANLVTTTGVPDNWSITWCDADGRLWGHHRISLQMFRTWMDLLRSLSELLILKG